MPRFCSVKCITQFSASGMTHYSPLVSAMVTLLLTFLLTLSKAGTVIQDIPNERSLHSEPVPRVGGIALMAGIFGGWVLLFKFLVWWIVLPALGLFALSFMDDKHNLPVRTRLIGHFAATLVAVLGAGVHWIWLLPLLLLVVWMTNLYNFMDGSDGLAGGMALFGFSFYGAASLVSGNDEFAMMNFSVGAAGLAFLYYNFHPAKVFMGDAGSIPLGFLAAAMGLWGWQQGYWPIWFSPLVFSPFVADATITLLKRARRGERLSEAHRSHYYQRLVQMGWGHGNTAIAEYALMFSVGVSALWGIKQDIASQGALLVGWVAIYFVLALWIDHRWRRHEATKETI